MESSIVTTQVLRASDTDFLGRFRPSSIFMGLQEAAGTHSEKLGVGFKTLYEKEAAWVLVRMELHMQAYPMLYDRVNIRTWPGMQKRWFFPRYYVLETPEGKQLGVASSLWTLLNLRERSMLPPSNINLTMPDTSALTPPLPFPQQPETVDAEPVEHIRVPSYSDLDINGHVNNTRYVDWLCDALGVAALRGHLPGMLRMAYHAEVRSGEPVRLLLSRKEEAFYLCGKQGEETKFEAGGTLMPVG